MSKIRVLSIDQGTYKSVLWYEGTTNDVKGFVEFVQYVLDNFLNPEKFYIVADIDSKEFTCSLLNIAQLYGMRVRTFEERMNNELVCADFVKDMLV